MEYEEVEVNSERWFDLTPLLNEEFRDINILLGEYQVSNYGRIKSLKSNKIMTNYKMKIDNYQKGRETTHNNYYCRVHLCSKRYNINKHFYVQILVAQAYLKDYSIILEVNHKNGIKSDNKLCNLELTTPSENVKHSYDKLTRGKRKRAIQMLDKSKNIIEEFECMSDAKRKYGYLVSVLCNAIKNNYYSYNHYWKYKEEN